jgi:hypothetical protein
MWKRYAWAEVDPDSLPWLANSEEPVNSETPFIGELVDPADRADALGMGFDPNHTYYTVLAHEWNGHPVGARVLLEATEIAVELAASAHVPDVASIAEQAMVSK